MLKNRLIQSLLLLILIAPAHAQEPEVFVQFGHSWTVNAVAFSKDGRLALSDSGPFIGEEHTLKLWDVQSGRSIRTFKGHSSAVGAIAFSNDGRLALSGSADHTLKLWEVQSGRAIRTFKGHSDTVLELAFSNDGHLALSSSLDILKLWDVQSGREIHTFNGHSDYVRGVALSNDGHLALSGSADDTLKLWDVQSGREIRTFKGHSHNVNAVALSNDGRLALSGSTDDTLKLWDVQSGRSIRTFKGHSSSVFAVALSNDGRLALSGSKDDTLKLWEVESGREIRTFKGHSDVVNVVAFSNDGRLALSGSWDGSIRFWNIQTGDEIAQIVVFEDGEWATVTRQGYYVSSSGGEKYINATVGTQVSSISPYRRQFKRPDLVAAILQAGKLDRQPPRLQIYSKQRSVENELVVDTYRYTLRGRAIDDSKIATVTVNGKPVYDIDPQGYFNQDLPLQVGQNQVHITATDIFDNTARKTLSLNYSPKSHQTVAGDNYALVIGINDYQHDKVTDLDTAVNDALAVATRLRNDYHFKVTTLINAQATRYGILQAFSQMANQAQAQDNLLVYYAGHGQRHSGIDKAYWFPVDARPNAEYTWIMAERITGYMKSSQATHVLVIADSCYSGALSKTRNMPWLSNPKAQRRAIARLKQHKSRILIASGGDKPVSDGDGGKHSIFAEAMIEGLDTFKAFQQDFTAHELFLYVREQVAGNSSQLPGIHFIINSGHKGGDFVFELR